MAAGAFMTGRDRSAATAVPDTSAAKAVAAITSFIGPPHLSRNAVTGESQFAQAYGGKSLHTEVLLASNHTATPTNKAKFNLNSDTYAVDIRVPHPVVPRSSSEHGPPQRESALIGIRTLAAQHLD